MLLNVAAPVLAVIIGLVRRLFDCAKVITEPAEREIAVCVVELARCQGALRSCRATNRFRPLSLAFEQGRRASRRALWWATGGSLLSGAFTQVVVVAMIMFTAELAVRGSLSPVSAVVTIGLCLRFATMLDDLSAAVLALEERRQMMTHLDAEPPTGLHGAAAAGICDDAPHKPTPSSSHPRQGPARGRWDVRRCRAPLRPV